ncbi:MAG: polysaccharide deacetylase family protein, partial [Mycobacterium sp.]
SPPCRLSLRRWRSRRPRSSSVHLIAAPFYITIDDGWYPNYGVVALMRSGHIPITAFLISHAAAEDLDFWRSFIAAGGDIEDHTVSHPNLMSVSEAAAEAQWAGAAHAFEIWFGVVPTLGRPPYGYVNRTVRIAAGQAGLREVVMWTATMTNEGLTTYDGRPLRAGEIVILHWIPGLYDDLIRLLAIASAEGLHPAPPASSLGLSLS